MGLAFVRERMDRSVRSVDDLEKLLGLPVFGTIPAIAPKGKRTRQSVSPLLVRIEQRSAALEAFRTLRTNIQFALPEVQAKCFLLTSPGPGEGKSLTCANLAIALAQMGGRIILMDADLRKPVLHRHFRVPQEAGLSNLLAGQIEWRSAVRPTRVENLDVLPAGLIPPNPPEILGSNRMKLLVQELVRHYDVILLDSPPVLLFTDASVLGSMVDGVFLVAKAGVTTPEAILRTKGLLQAGSARVLGSILIAARREHSYHSHGYSRYYGGEDGWLMRLKHEIRRWNSRR
jgi:capsular exopolysaccharide synthesis family protein